MEAALTVSPPDLQYSIGYGNHDGGGHFRHFGIFFFWNVQQGLIPKHIIEQQFFSRQLLAALACVAAKMRTSVIARTRGVVVSKAL